MESELLDRARAYAVAGEHAKCAATCDAALADPATTPAERAHMLCHLSVCHRAGGRVDDAVRASQAAIRIAVSAADRRAEAHAQLMLATALLEGIEASGNWDAFSDVMSSLDRAASIYEEMGSIDLGGTLLTMADAMMMAGEPEAARGVYARITRDLADPRWAAHDATARHADHLRGRAFVCLGQIALGHEHRDEAHDHFEAGVSLLVAARDPIGAPILQQVATWLEWDLSDPRAARRVRAAVQTLHRSS